MSDPEKNLDVLQNLETVIAELWRKNPELSDYVALRAYENAFQLYRAEARGFTPKDPQLTGLDAIAFADVREICQWRLGRTTEPAGEPPIKPITIEDLLDCLRQLIKSVERHTKIDGRQGYLRFIAQFV